MSNVKPRSRTGQAAGSLTRACGVVGCTTTYRRRVVFSGTNVSFRQDNQQTLELCEHRPNSSPHDETIRVDLRLTNDARTDEFRRRSMEKLCEIPRKFGRKQLQLSPLALRMCTIGFDWPCAWTAKRPSVETNQASSGMPARVSFSHPRTRNAPAFESPSICSSSNIASGVSVDSA